MQPWLAAPGFHPAPSVVSNQPTCWQPTRPTPRHPLPQLAQQQAQRGLHRLSQENDTLTRLYTRLQDMQCGLLHRGEQ